MTVFRLGGFELLWVSLAFAWLTYAGYRLWTGTASPTARFLSLGLILLIAMGLLQDLLDFSRG
ncbi:hypothetical protein [Meiothermus rufus]|uniref:hypothetical protein n=1 Tax=Meiothermus rufus TaxID=604332 RepID=UPI00041B96D3|nr:hypothetical protein [Meiothermus rufus]